jgi:hypothetical protein
MGNVKPSTINLCNFVPKLSDNVPIKLLAVGIYHTAYRGSSEKNQLLK